jgi:hypothetical protein
VVAGDAVPTKSSGRGEYVRCLKLAMLHAARDAERESRTQRAREDTDGYTRETASDKARWRQRTDTGVTLTPNEKIQWRSKSAAFAESATMVG